MPKLNFEKSIDIAGSPERVFDVLSNLASWRPWNPWLVLEPTAEVTVAPDGKSYAWVGKITGEGEMRITAENRPSSIDLDLVFLKPFKSKAAIRFSIEPRPIESGGQGTHVSWSMDSSLPFFLFFMKKLMTALLGMDYQRGLTMLKDYVETGEVPSRLGVQGPSSYPGCRYVGITTECAIDELGPRMAADFQRLQKWKETDGSGASGEAFSLYHTWDLPRGKVKYTSGFPIAAMPADVPADFVIGEIPKLPTFAIEHVGPYRHLGNAWSVGMQLARSREFRQSKSHPPFEVYTTPLGSTPETEQRVLVHFPAS